jgi:mediator of RNA polymerase II transcription subunit 4
VSWSQVRTEVKGDLQLRVCSKVARHQVAQKELLRIEAEIESKKQKIVQYAAQLRRSQEDIANVLRKHRVVLENAKQKARGGARNFCERIEASCGLTDVAASSVVLDPNDIVAYAHRIAGTTSAPKEWQPGVRLARLADRSKN